MFTQNRVVAAPVILARRNLRRRADSMRAILVNAGNANCATRTGEQVALETRARRGESARDQAEEVLPASTGVIGVELDARQDHRRAARARWPALEPRIVRRRGAAILTTDSVRRPHSPKSKARGSPG